MPDDKSGRDKQARDAERRQRERAIATELERADEAPPPVDTSELAYFETELETLEFPTTGAEIVEALGDHTLESGSETYTVAELLPDTDVETFESPTNVRQRVQRPSVSATMKRIVEAGETLRDETVGGSQFDAYEKTLQELQGIDADDHDEGVRVIGDWIVERIKEDETVPKSRDVRREAAKFCRKNGYSVRNEEWLGI